ncbi:MAG: formyltransferase family protein [Balneolaceae bacterium]|nr:formyltransferase family protein [Balneolaceae bacterium]
MNFVIVTQKDLFFTPEFFRVFLASDYPGTCRGVVVQSTLGNRSTAAFLKRMHAFYGTKDFLLQGLRHLKLTLQARLYDTGLTSRPVSIENWCRRHGVPVLDFQSVNSPGFKNWLKEHTIDLVVSIAASEKFDEELLELPPMGCINFHNAPLPRYRGMLPNFWQMYHGEEVSTLTVHEMTPELDRGAVLYRQETPIRPEYSFYDLAEVTKRRSAEALAEILKRYRENRMEKKPMPEGEGSYFTFPGREDVKAFKQKGNRLI